MLDRETTYQIGVSGGAVLLFIAASLTASTMYGSNGHLTTEGGFMLVGALFLFVVATAIAGLWLARTEF